MRGSFAPPPGGLSTEKKLAIALGAAALVGGIVLVATSASASPRDEGRGQQPVSPGTTGTDTHTTPGPGGVQTGGGSGRGPHRSEQGADVVNYQRILIAMGYDLGRTGADGTIGQKTRAALTTFQRTYNAERARPDDRWAEWEPRVLDVDGILGPRTREALDHYREDLGYGASTRFTAPAPAAGLSGPLAMLRRVQR